MNYQTSYLKFVFGMMGVKNTRIFSFDNEEFGGAVFQRSKELIYKEIKGIS